MKILHIVPTYIPAYRYGGPIESVHALNKALVGAGAEVTLFTTNIDGAHNLDVPLGIPVIKDGVKVFYFPSSFPRAWFYSKALRNVLTEYMHKFDIVHITSVFLAASFLGAHYAKKFKKPYIISPRGSLMKEPLSKNSFKKWFYLTLIEKQSLKNAAAIHFTSEDEQKEYKEMYFPSHEKDFVIANPVDTLFFTTTEASDFRGRYQIPKEAPVVLFLSRITWKKGLDTLIPAWDLVLERMPDAYLVIAGPDDENYLSRVLPQNDIKKKNIIISGMLTRSQKIGAFKHSDMFVLPSYSENFGMAVAEAMFCKKPVIITPQVGISGVVKKTGAGLVIEKDPNLFAEAIIKLIKDKELSKKMGENGQKSVIENFSVGAISKKMLEVYKKLIV